MPAYCVSYGCTNRQSKHKPLRFFSFPSAKLQTKRREMWINAVKRAGDKHEQWKPSIYNRLCGEHFIEGKPSKFQTHPDYVPSVFSFARKRTGKTARFQRLQKRNSETRGKNNSDFTAGPVLAILDPAESIGDPLLQKDTQPDEHMMTAVEGLLSLQKSVERTKLVEDQASQTSDNNNYSLLCIKIQELETENENLRKEVHAMTAKTLSLESARKDSAIFKFYTGLENAEVFEALIDYLEDNALAMNYWYGKRSQDANGNPSSASREDRQRRKTSIQEEMFMVLVRLRTGMPCREICRNFDVSMSQFSSIFSTWILFLAKELQIFSFVPEMRAVSQFTPKSFKDLNNTRIVLDATEVRIQRPSSRTAQKKTFSTYKHFNTFKVLIGCTPDGYLNFISDLWSGSVSDKELVSKSGLLDILQPGDAIMTDKGFDIEDILPAGVQLYMPPFHKKLQGQMPVCDLKKTQKIASARVHVERLIRRIKEFHIMDKPFPLSMADIAQQVFSVCALLVNLQKPLINEQRE